MYIHISIYTYIQFFYLPVPQSIYILLRRQELLILKEWLFSGHKTGPAQISLKYLSMTTKSPMEELNSWWNMNKPMKKLNIKTQTYTKHKKNSSWWFHPLWKILVKLDHLPQIGVKIKNIWNHHPVIVQSNMRSIGHFQGRWIENPKMVRQKFCAQGYFIA